MAKEKNEQLESMIEVIESLIHEIGYKTLRMSSKDSPVRTTAYDALVFKNNYGKEFTITFDESKAPKKLANGEQDLNNLVSTNYISDSDMIKVWY